MRGEEFSCEMEGRNLQMSKFEWIERCGSKLDQDGEIHPVLLTINIVKRVIAMADVMPEPKPEPAAGAPPAEEPRDGTVAVRGGCVVVTDPEAGGQPAVLVPNPGLVIEVNGVRLTGPTPVRASDRIAMATPEEEHQAGVQVVIAPDRMTASVILSPRTVRRRRPADSPPATRLCPGVQEETQEEWTLGVDAVMSALAEKGVTTGLDMEAITAAVNARDRKAQVVARGTPPTPGSDGFVERLFPDGPVPVTPASERASVDHRQRFVLPLVKAGELLAVRHPAAPGQPGVTVTGDAVPAKPVREASLKVADGAAFAEDGVSAIALRAGMPVASGNPANMTVRVNPVLDHPGDVDLSSGNLIFDGEIIVRGSVMHGMTVRATGSVTVNGLVEGAIIEAGRGVHLAGSVIGAQVRAGGSRAAFRIRHLLPDLELLAEDMRHLLAACEQLAESGGAQARDILEARAGQAIMTLLPGQVKAIQDRFASLAEHVEPGGEGFPAELVAWFDAARKRLVGLGPLSIRGIGELREMTEGIETIHGTLAAQLGAPAPIVAPYVQNSILEATGDIEITGQGCFYATLRAGGSARVNGTFRGSTVTAQAHVTIARAGSPHATDRLCEIAVAGGGTIDLHEVAPNVVVRVGHRSHRFDDALTGVRVHLDQAGELQFDSIPENRG